MDGNSLVINFTFGMRLTGSDIDVQAFQWYTVIADPAYKYGFKVESAHMVPVATPNGKTSVSVWPSEHELLQLLRGRYAELEAFNPEVAALKSPVTSRVLHLHKRAKPNANHYSACDQAQPK